MLLPADSLVHRFQACWTSTCQGKQEIEAFLDGEVPAYLRFNYKPKCLAEGEATIEVPKWAMWPAPLVTG